MAIEERKISGDGHVTIADWVPVDNSGKHKDSNEIEHDIDNTRHTMDSILDSITSRLNPKTVLNSISDRFSTRSITDAIFDMFERPDNRQRTQEIISRFTNNLSQSFQRNPLPVILMSAGAVWLVWEGQNKHEQQMAVRKEGDKGIQERLREGYQSAREKITGTADDLKEKAQSRMESAKENVDQMRSQMQSQYEGKSEEYKQRMQETTNRGYSLLEKNPLVAGAATFVFGLIAGALIPESNRENMIYGESAEQVRQTAADQTMETLRKGEEKTEETLSVMSEPKRENPQTTQPVNTSETNFVIDENKPEGPDLKGNPNM